MALQASVPLRNARLDAVETLIGPSPTLRVRTGAQPSSTAASDSGVTVATIALPADWMLPAAGGSKAKSGTWDDASADAAGTAGHYRIYDAAGVCHLQGSVTATGGGGDMTLDNVVFAAGQAFSITGYTLNDNNA